jgi:hypothetical protein
MPLAFRIFKLRDDGSQHFVEEAENVEDAESASETSQGYGPVNTSFKKRKREGVVITSNGVEGMFANQTNSETCLSMLPVADDLPQLQL